MASIEREILKGLTEAINNHMRWSLSSPMGQGNDQSIAYAVGFRQGVYKGLQTALEYVNGLLEDRAKKDDLL